MNKRKQLHVDVYQAYFLIRGAAHNVSQLVERSVQVAGGERSGFVGPLVNEMRQELAVLQREVDKLAEKLGK